MFNLSALNATGLPQLPGAGGLPQMPGGIQPMMQSPLAQHMAMAGGFQGVQAPQVQMPAATDGSDALMALRQQMAGRMPGPMAGPTGPGSTGVSPTSMTPPAAPTGAPIAGAAPGGQGQPLSVSDILQHMAAAKAQVQSLQGGGNPLSAIMNMFHQGQPQAAPMPQASAPGAQAAPMLGAPPQPSPMGQPSAPGANGGILGQIMGLLGHGGSALGAS